MVLNLILGMEIILQSNSGTKAKEDLADATRAVEVSFLIRCYVVYPSYGLYIISFFVSPIYSVARGFDFGF